MRIVWIVGVFSLLVGNLSYGQVPGYEAIIYGQSDNASAQVRTDAYEKNHSDLNLVMPCGKADSNGKVIEMNSACNHYMLYEANGVQFERKGRGLIDGWFIPKGLTVKYTTTLMPARKTENIYYRQVLVLSDGNYVYEMGDMPLDRDHETDLYVKEGTLEPIHFMDPKVIQSRLSAVLNESPNSKFTITTNLRLLDQPKSEGQLAGTVSCVRQAYLSINRLSSPLTENSVTGVVIDIYDGRTAIRDLQNDKTIDHSSLKSENLVPKKETHNVIHVPVLVTKQGCKMNFTRETIADASFIPKYQSPSGPTLTATIGGATR